MIIDAEDYIEHIGVARRSGRYPWGSGQDENTHNKSFLDYVGSLRSQGLTEVQIAEGLGLSTTQLRAQKSIAKNQQKQAQIGQAERLKAKGWSNTAIGENMGLNESTVRSLLAPGQKEKAQILNATSDMLKAQVSEKTYIDVGSGVENQLGMSDTRLRNAVAVLQEEGYEVHTIPVRQLGTGEFTKVKVLALPGTTWGDVARNQSDIKQIKVTVDETGGLSDLNMYPPLVISPKRVGVKYGPDGGADADGVIYVRPGVADVSLGNSQYAQVRISVGKDKYLKGMAMYKDDLPDGVDLLFNTNKEDTGNHLDAMKTISDDPTNPYTAVLKRQLTTRKPDGTVKVTSAMNIVNEEGDWAKWSKSLSTQMLSKQSQSLAKTQLDMTFEDRKKEFAELSALTNPVIKRDLLIKFGDGTDAAAVHLKAKALPNQGSHVILPMPSISPTQIYAPNYADGTRVALIRYPHGGTFEIPELTVNNNHAPAVKLLGRARDAVGIHPQVAERLSGADFDGDTVLVIPNNSGKVKSTPALTALKDFNPRIQYKAYENMPKMTPSKKQSEMGYISNLITDMTIKGASTEELARAVKHSMVVIDAEKHNLNYKQSALDNGIAGLNAKYQGSARGGAATLISKSGMNAKATIAEVAPRAARDGGPIDKDTGKRVFVETGASYIDGSGKVVQKISKVPKLALVDDAHILTSGTTGTPMERLYADHSNRLKDMANAARKEAINTPPSKWSASAKQTYADEVKTLNAKLEVALMNRPLERQAQILGNAKVKQLRAADPNMDDATLKKVQYKALESARARTGAKKEQIVITPREWEAIQAGAISSSKLTEIVANANTDVIRDLATPKVPKLMTPTKIKRAEAMIASGATRAEIVAQLGVSLTTLDEGLSVSTSSENDFAD